MMNKTLLLLEMGLVSIGLLSPASATQRYLNSDGMPNYSQLSSNTNGNQLSASMWDGLVAGLNTTSSRFFQLVTAINQSLTELSTRQEQHFSQVKTQMSSMDAYLRAHLPVQCSTGAEVPDPINGKCGTTLGGCTNGTPAIISITAECGQKSIWNCNGLHGGSNVSCEASNPACAVAPQPLGHTSLNVTPGRTSTSVQACQGTQCGQQYSVSSENNHVQYQKALWGQTAIAVIPARTQTHVVACQGTQCSINTVSSESNHVQYQKALWGQTAIAVIPARTQTHVVACQGTQCSINTVSSESSKVANATLTQEGDVFVAKIRTGYSRLTTFRCQGSTCTQY